MSKVETSHGSAVWGSEWANFLHIDAKSELSYHNSTECCPSAYNGTHRQDYTDFGAPRASAWETELAFNCGASKVVDGVDPLVG